MKYIIDIKGEIEGDYEIIGKYEERPMGERKKGEWIPVDDRDVPYGLLFKCSECGTEVIVNDALEHNFCSECGCDMRGNQDENN